MYGQIPNDVAINKQGHILLFHSIAIIMGIIQTIHLFKIGGWGKATGHK